MAPLEVLAHSTNEGRLVRSWLPLNGSQGDKPYQSPRSFRFDGRGCGEAPPLGISSRLVHKP